VPRITPERFAAFFAGAEGWGLRAPERGVRRQTNRIEVRAGVLRLQRFHTRFPELDSSQPRVLRIILDGRELSSVEYPPRDDVDLELGNEITVAAGQTLQFEWTW